MKINLSDKLNLFFSNLERKIIDNPDVFIGWIISGIGTVISIITLIKSGKKECE